MEKSLVLATRTNLWPLLQTYYDHHKWRW